MPSRCGEFYSVARNIRIRQLLLLVHWSRNIELGSGSPFDASSEVHGGKDLAVTVAVGCDKVRGGSCRVWGEGVTRTELLQKEREGGDSLLASTDSSNRHAP